MIILMHLGLGLTLGPKGQGRTARKYASGYLCIVDIH